MRKGIVLPITAGLGTPVYHEVLCHFRRRLWTMRGPLVAPPLGADPPESP